MKPMLIDFAGEGGHWRWDWRQPGTRLFVVLLVLACAAGGLALQRGWQVRQEAARLELSVAASQAAQARAALAERKLQQGAAGDLALLRQAERHRSLPWEAIFRAFEAAPPARLESFEPDVARGVVKVRAHVADAAAVQVYVRGLQRNPVFQRVSLLRHEVAETGGVDFAYEAVLATPYRLPLAGQEPAP